MDVKLRVMLGIIITSVIVAFVPSSVYAGGGNGRVTVSYYGGGGPNECGLNRPCNGSLTKCGQVFNMNKVSVAHQSLPCGTKVRFCYKDNCLVAKVNDSGDFEKLGREYDLSRQAAKQLGIYEVGKAVVNAKVLGM